MRSRAAQIQSVPLRFPSAVPAVWRPALRTKISIASFVMTDHLKSAPVAYENPSFLNSPDGRILRIMAEYQEPLARFRREQIQDTVVFFGSARFQGHKDASETLATIERNHAATPTEDLQKELKRALAA